MTYSIHFDKILNAPKESEEMIQKRKERMEEAKRREKEWLEKSSVVEGIPGRCKIVERGTEKGWLKKELFKMWMTDTESILYSYNDISFLSGTAGYVLKLKDGKMFRQVTLKS
jgi:hypothetical protein